MNKFSIRLDLISLDAGTQQRPLDEDILAEYIKLMDDGTEFPPIEVVSDGAHFWPWDGFHRIECAWRRGLKVIDAFVREGTIRDAIWFSFSANRDHGLRRQKGVARQIIEKILIDSSWSKKSLTAIAKHVGVSREYVSKTKAELSAHGVNSSHHRIEGNSDSESKTKVHRSIVHTVSRSKEIEVERSGKKYKQKSQEKQHKADEPMKDKAGRVIPERLQKVYQDRAVILGLLKQLDEIKNVVMKMHEVLNDPVFTLLNMSAFQSEFGALRQRLKSSMPYAICVYCGGDSKSCKACHGFGLVNKESYTMAPRELKA